MSVRKNDNWQAGYYDNESQASISSQCICVCKIELKITCATRMFPSTDFFHAYMYLEDMECS